MKLHKKLILLITLLIICFSTTLFTGCNMLSCSSCGRSATNNDINIDLSEEISLSVNYKILPNVNINDLEITFKYYDNNNNILSTKVKKVGNVTKGNQVTVTISLSEFSFTDIFKINYTSAEVTGGTVPFFE